MKQNIVVWFSCGAASAVAAKKTFEKYSQTHNVLIVNHPIDEEDADNKRFLKDVGKWIGTEIIEYSNPEISHTSVKRIWDEKKYMAGYWFAYCTHLLKKGSRYAFEKEVKVDWHVLGFTADEKHRHERFVKFERENVIPILIEEGITKNDCFTILTDAGIELPLPYKIGMPNANCYGCPKATSPTYWNLIREKKPDVFQERAEQSRKLGVKLVRYKGKRIFLDELPADAKGHKIKSYECGIFCDTK